MFEVLGAAMCQQSWFLHLPRVSVTHYCGNENMIGKIYHFVESIYFN